MVTKLHVCKFHQTDFNSDFNPNTESKPKPNTILKLDCYSPFGWKMFNTIVYCTLTILSALKKKFNIDPGILTQEIFQKNF